MSAGAEQEAVIRIEFLYTPGCATEVSGHALLESVLEEAGLRTEIQRVTVRSTEQAEELGFPGSPTIRINGRDIDPAVTPSTPAGLG